MKGVGILKSIDKLRNLAIVPDDDIKLFLNEINMPDGKISVTSMADLHVINFLEMKQYTYEQFIDLMIKIKVNNI